MATSGNVAPQGSGAAAAFQHQLAEVDAVRSAHAWHPMFRAWKERTAELFERFLPDSVFCANFLAIQFAESPSSGGADDETASHASFLKACERAATCLKSAIAQV